MAIRESQRIVLKTLAARDKAEALLDGLIRAKTQAERHLGHAGPPTADAAAEPHQALTRAIGSTHQLIERLNQVTELARLDLDDQAIDLLGEAVAEFDCCDRLIT